MNTRYIEIDSTHRDRNLYPSVGEFIIPIAGTNGCNGPPALSAVDPVVSAAPVYVFVKGFFNQEGQCNGGTYINPNLDVSLAKPYDPTNPKGNSQWYSYIVPNVYGGYFFFDKLGFSGSSSTASDGTVRNIATSSGAGSCALILDVPEPNALYGPLDYYTIADMSGINTSTGSNFPNYTPAYDWSAVWCTQSIDIYGKRSPNVRNAFFNYYLKVEPDVLSTYYPARESKRIISYDEIAQLAFIESPFTENLPNSDVDLNNVVTVRTSPPTETFESGGSVLQVYLTGGAPAITSGSNILTTVGATPLAAGGANYKGNYIFIIPKYTDPILKFNYPDITLNDAYNYKRSLFMYRIIGYNADNTFLLDRPVDLANYDGNTLDGRFMEILHVVRDNFVPLNYSGSIVSQNETVCYEIALVALTLPNVPLASGSRVAFYPYVYVLLENATNGSGTMKNIFYSNNPPTSRALFVAPVTDTNDPENTPYVRITGFGITQTVKFKPNDALHFKVFMPDGSVFQPIYSDDVSPLPPNPYYQVRAVFSIRRI